jgi:hypothetical protein
MYFDGEGKDFVEPLQQDPFTKTFFHQKGSKIHV